MKIMKTVLPNSIITVLLLCISPVIAAPLDQTTQGLPEGLYHKNISSGLVDEVHHLFPELTEVNPAYIDTSLDPNLHLQQDATVSLTFIDEGAGYLNSFGYFLFDENENVLEEHLLFGNASKINEGGFLTPGDSIDFGSSFNGDGSINPLLVGTNIGFYLTPNGWEDSHPADNFYTLDSLNPDTERHVAMVYSNTHEAIVVGIEDIWWDWSDKDCNDILFTITTDPASALVEIVEEGNIPSTSVPIPATIWLFGTGLAGLIGLRARPKEKRIF